MSEEYYMVTVIIPTYKRSITINRAVDSVINQSIKDIEIIVVDDNHSDSEERYLTEKAMEKYSTFPNIKYIKHPKNLNGSAARNTGIKLAKGDYISFLDDDDEYTPTRLEKMSNYLSSLDDTYGACYSGYIKMMPNGKNQVSDETIEGDLFVVALMRSLYIGSGSNLFFKREVVEKIGLFNEDFLRNQDLEYLVRVLQSFKMAHLNENLLKINYDVRTNYSTYEDEVERERLYEASFSSFIQSLDEKNKKKVFKMFGLERIRIAMRHKKILEACKIYKKHSLSFSLMMRYLKYFYDRYRSNTSYGFKKVY